MSAIALLIAMASFAAWLYLVAGRGFFWLARERDDLDDPAPPAHWPSVAAIVPARNEADVIEQSLSSLIGQDYAGTFHIILVDDQSTDQTAASARALMRDNRLTVVSGVARPTGWTGKLWAQQQGIERAMAHHAPDYLWLTDADIAHAPDTLASLVARAEQGRVLVSLMAKLRCETFAERMFVPAFVYYFDMLYPFAWVNGNGRTAAAAGGCMLVRRTALEAADGIAQIKGRIIDDCALGSLMKAKGPIWLGLTKRSVSLRPYVHIGDVGQMIARSAYAQLDYSAPMLIGTVIGMLLIFAAPPLLAVFAGGWPRALGSLAWVLMIISLVPMLRFYGRSPLWGVVLPIIGAAYTAFTIQSAIQFWRGKGGMWKGRPQAMPS
ncbi:MAG TPA: glycosyltransferase [Rhizomicrobium sp.]|jgi:hopene-associated glycosyltransferase HpnB